MVRTRRSVRGVAGPPEHRELIASPSDSATPGDSERGAWGLRKVESTDVVCDDLDGVRVVRSWKTATA